MTKFILVGGYPGRSEDGGRRLSEEMVAGFSQPVKMLLCFFARPKNVWDQVFAENIVAFQNNLPGKKLDFQLASEEEFITQLNWSDSVYLAGGDTSTLTKRLVKIPSWQDHLKGKTVMGSSAGTDLLSKYNYDIEKFKCLDGLGLVPVKTIVHFGSEEYKLPIAWDQAHKEIKAFKEKLPVWVLREGEYKIWEK